MDHSSPHTNLKLLERTGALNTGHLRHTTHDSNGQAEAAVKIAKNIMSKAKRQGRDVYKALLDYRNTPRTTTGLSPAQVILQRKTRTATLPQSPEYSAADEAARNAKRRHQRSIKAAHDKSAHQLPALSIGARIWSVTWADGKERWTRGIVQGVNDREYTILSSETQRLFKRNRVHVKPDRTHEDDTSDEDDNDITAEHPQHHPPSISHTPTTVPRREQGYGFVPPTNTRSGRAVKPVSLEM